MDLIMRNETEADYRQVEALTREAFWNVYVPGCEEHYLAHVIRGTKEFIPELDVVAELDGCIVGNIMYAESSIVSEQGETYPVITFGPLSVLPSCQKSGVGRKLIEYTKEKAAQMGFLAIVICGDPAYYSRFGFTAAEEYGIRNGEGFYAAALQICELRPGAMDGICGRFEEGEAYQMDSLLAEEFDKTFPPREKGTSVTQNRFRELIGMVHL